jgi:NAD(P)-dependent dehydrogenase (short-subunit alcohol dehydrogenase family)
MARSVVETFGAINILVNSAGITKRLPPLDFPEEDFDRIIAVNLKGTFLCCQAAARQMAQQGGGKIVNLTSIGGMVGLPNTVAYCASKGGVVQMTRALAIDLAPSRINVNAIAPSLANTPIATTVFQNQKTLDWFLSKVPLGRLCEPRDVSEAVLFLSSSASDFITGHVLAVDGGYLAQ